MLCKFHGIRLDCPHGKRDVYNDGESQLLICLECNEIIEDMRKKDEHDYNIRALKRRENDR